MRTARCIFQVVCTRWGADPLARGSYSSIAVGALGGEEYDILGQSVAARVFFAGEATTKKHPATMHGAFFSGLREVRAGLSSPRLPDVSS
jgi:lysine-specific histone demethylase 1